MRIKGDDAHEGCLWTTLRITRSFAAHWNHAVWSCLLLQQHGLGKMQPKSSKGGGWPESESCGPSPGLCLLQGPLPCKGLDGAGRGAKWLCNGHICQSWPNGFSRSQRANGPTAGRELLLSGALYLTGNIRAMWPQATRTQRTAALPASLN